MVQPMVHHGNIFQLSSRTFSGAAVIPLSMNVLEPNAIPNMSLLDMTLVFPGRELRICPTFLSWEFVQLFWVGFPKPSCQSFSCPTFPAAATNLWCWPQICWNNQQERVDKWERGNSKSIVFYPPPRKGRDSKQIWLLVLTRAIRYQRPVRTGTDQGWHRIKISTASPRSNRSLLWTLPPLIVITLVITFISHSLHGKSLLLLSFQRFPS